MEFKITCKSISDFFKKLQMPELAKVSSQILIGLKKKKSVFHPECLRNDYFMARS